VPIIRHYSLSDIGIRRAIYNFVPRTHAQTKTRICGEDIKPRAFKNVAPTALSFSYKNQKNA